MGDPEDFIDQGQPSSVWQNDWLEGLWTFHANSQELADLLGLAKSPRRAEVHLRRCALCRERLGLAMARRVSDQPDQSSRVEILRLFAEHAEAVVRASAARAIARLEDPFPETLEYLERLQRDEDKMVRADASAVTPTVVVAAATPVQQHAGGRDVKNLVSIAEWREQHRKRTTQGCQRAIEMSAGATAVSIEPKAVNLAHRMVSDWRRTWTDERGESVVVRLTESPGDRILVVDTEREDLRNRLIHCALIDPDVAPGQPRGIAFEGWLVLHEDPVNEGHFHGAVRIEPTVNLPVKRDLVLTPDPILPMPRSVFELCLRQAATPEDEQALQSWVDACADTILIDG